jgi:hypothetical protein
MSGVHPCALRPPKPKELMLTPLASVRGKRGWRDWVGQFFCTDGAMWQLRVWSASTSYLTFGIKNWEPTLWIGVSKLDVGWDCGCPEARTALMALVIPDQPSKWPTLA